MRWGLAPTADSCTSISRFPNPAALHIPTAAGRGCQHGPVPVSTTGGWGCPSDYRGGHVSVPGCLSGQLRGCLNVVTGTRESACCDRMYLEWWCGCHPLFLCSSVRGLWVVCGSVRCVPVTCNSDALSMCHQSILGQFGRGLTRWLSAL